MKRNIGAELAARMTHLNEMLANGESVGAISRADVDSPQPVASTPPTHATPDEGSVRAGRTCHRCGGDGIQLTEANTYGEATCGTCGGSGRLD